MVQTHGSKLMAATSRALHVAARPQEDHWQLLPHPMGLAHWWRLPHMSIAFLARGMVLLEELELGDLRSVNTLPAPRCA